MPPEKLILCGTRVLTLKGSPGVITHSHSYCLGNLYQVQLDKQTTLSLVLRADEFRVVPHYLPSFHPSRGNA